MPQKQILSTWWDARDQFHSRQHGQGSNLLRRTTIPIVFDNMQALAAGYNGSLWNQEKHCADGRCATWMQTLFCQQRLKTFILKGASAVVLR